jgi:acyl-CoA thioester hydrolase
VSQTPLRPRTAYRAWTTISTRWFDNDIYAHVNNTVYYEWFDTAVNGWLVERELLVPGGNDHPIGLVVETGCRYVRPISFPAAVEVGLRVARIGRSSVIYELGAFTAAEAPAAAEARFVHVYVDPIARRPIDLPLDWRRALADLADA